MSTSGAVDPVLAPPPGLQPSTWGSLVHEILESRLAPSGTAGRPVPSPELRDRLEGELGSSAAADRAVAGARDLAEVFLRSELGSRARAAKERSVELGIAVALEPEPLSPRWARGVIDLAFIEEARVVVVDYQTDAAMLPKGHAVQLGIYAKAAESVFGKKAEAWIFYLYGGGRAVRLERDDARLNHD